MGSKQDCGIWEQFLGNPLPSSYKNTKQFVDYRGAPFSRGTQGDFMPAEQVLGAAGTIPPLLGRLPFPDPNQFIAGNTSTRGFNWEQILSGPQKDTHLRWVTDGVDIRDFVRPFSGQWSNEDYGATPYPGHAFLPMRRFVIHFLITFIIPCQMTYAVGRFRL